MQWWEKIGIVIINSIIWIVVFVANFLWAFNASFSYQQYQKIPIVETIYVPQCTSESESLEEISFSRSHHSAIRPILSTLFCSIDQDDTANESLGRRHWICCLQKAASILLEIPNVVFVQSFVHVQSSGREFLENRPTPSTHLTKPYPGLSAAYRHRGKNIRWILPCSQIHDPERSVELLWTITYSLSMVVVVMQVASAFLSKGTQNQVLPEDGWQFFLATGRGEPSGLRGLPNWETIEKDWSSIDRLVWT